MKKGNVAISGGNGGCPEEAPYLADRLSQTRAYAHEIAFTWGNPRDIDTGACLNRSNRLICTSTTGIRSAWQEQSPTAAKSSAPA